MPYSESFDEYFNMISANSDELRRNAYRVRYEVYCLEACFLNPEDYPLGLEFDEYDVCSQHYLIRHRSTGVYAATTRLILPEAHNDNWLFPIEQYCSITQANSPLAGIPRIELGEISRLCVSTKFKRRKSDILSDMESSQRHESSIQHNRRNLPNLTLALFACLLRMSAQNGINYWCALMEFQAARLARVLGFEFTPIGPEIEFHGRRRPYMLNIANMLADIKIKNFAAWSLLTNAGNFWQDSRPETVAKWLLSSNDDK